MIEYKRTDRILLSLKDVNLQYGNKVIFRDVNATVTDVTSPGKTVGQVICFLGPSGIGKTQLSKTIAGLQPPTTGSILLADGTPTHKGKVGMVPQNYPLFDFLTVKDNLEVAGKQIGLSFNGIAKDDLRHKVENLSEQLGIKEHWNKYPYELSGGTQQRVAIARQFMCADHYLVMDEPFSGLDPISKRATAKLIVELSDMHEDNVIIIVTHDIKQGLLVSDTVWLMGLEEGKAGATLIDTYDLTGMGLCWQDGLATNPKFLDLVHSIEERFQTLR